MCAIGRICLMIINGLFLLLGIVMLAVGIWVVVDSSYLLTLISNFDTGSTNVGGLLSSSAYIIIAFGAFVFVLGFFGFCGAWKEMKFFLLIYAVLVFVVIAVEIVAVILAIIYYDTVVAEGVTLFTTALQANYDGQWDTANAFSLAIDGVQIGMMCCGISNSTDFALATNWNKTYMSDASTVHTATLPPTCCQFTDTTVFPAGNAYAGIANTACPYQAAAQTDSYMNTGCWDKLKSYVDSYSLTVIITVSVIAGIEVLAVLFACCLRKEIIDRDGGEK